MNVRKDKTKQIYVLETTATDTKNMEFIIKEHPAPMLPSYHPYTNMGFIVNARPCTHLPVCPCVFAHVAVYLLPPRLMG